MSDERFYHRDSVEHARLNIPPTSETAHERARSDRVKSRSRDERLALALGFCDRFEVILLGEHDRTASAAAWRYFESAQTRSLISAVLRAKRHRSSER
jgi:hypothetical protein